MEFRKIDIKHEESWLKRNFMSAHAKRTYLYILAGALAGFILYMLSGDKPFVSLVWNDAIPNVVLGAFFGFFITNSPCARNRC